MRLKRAFYFVVFIVLLFLPMVLNFIFIHGPADVLLRDVLFIEGVIFLVLGLQSGEYIWNYLRHWKKMREEHNYQTELMVGLALLAAGTIFILVALFIPSGINP